MREANEEIPVLLLRTATLDHTEIQDERCKYKVTCDNIWKDEKGTAWTAKI